jgi:phage protein D
MSLLTKIPTSGFFLPYFIIYLNGKNLTARMKQLIEEVVYEDTSTGSDLLTIVIRDPDFTLLSDPLIMKSTPVKFWGGFHNNYREMFNGFISMVDADFPEDGIPSLTITCMDASHMMNKIERKKVYKNMRGDQIVSQIAKSYGLVPIVDKSPGKVEESTTQSFETDIQFIQGLAEQDDFLTWVTGNALFYMKREHFMKQAPFRTYWYKKPPYDLINFRPRIIQADQKDTMDSSDIDSETNKTAKTTAKK